MPTQRSLHKFHHDGPGGLLLMGNLASWPKLNWICTYVCGILVGKYQFNLDRRSLIEHHGTLRSCEEGSERVIATFHFGNLISQIQLQNILSQLKAEQKRRDVGAWPKERWSLIASPLEMFDKETLLSMFQHKLEDTVNPSIQMHASTEWGQGEWYHTHTPCPSMHKYILSGHLPNAVINK